MIPNGILEGVFVLGFAMSFFTGFLNRLPFYIFANKRGV